MNMNDAVRIAQRAGFSLCFWALHGGKKVRSPNALERLEVGWCAHGKAAAMTGQNLEILFKSWERELALLLDTKPTHHEFWAYWREREAEVERLAEREDQNEIEAAFERLFSIAELAGYVRVPSLEA